MSYLEDTIDWSTVQWINDYLDREVASDFKEQPLAQDWARISKVAEELGEAIAAFIGMTGQNPRKGVTHTQVDLASELCDVALTAIYAMEHFGINGRLALMKRQREHYERLQR